MPALNTALGETVDSSSADTTTLVPGSGKQLKQGMRGLQQRKFRIGVKKQGSILKGKKGPSFKSPSLKVRGGKRV